MVAPVNLCMCQYRGKAAAPGTGGLQCRPLHGVKTNGGVGHKDKMNAFLAKLPLEGFFIRLCASSIPGDLS